MPNEPRAPVPRRTVEVSRGLLALLAGALIASLIGLAFLIGRETGRTSSPISPTHTAPPTAPAPANGRTPDEVPRSPDAAAASVVRDPATPLQQESSGSSRREPVDAQRAREPSPSTPPSQDGAARAAVARYFHEIESIDTMAVGNPEDLAMALLSQATAGDGSGFDTLSDRSQAVLDRLRRMSVPAACRQYHQQTITLVERAILLLDGVRDGVLAGDASALLQLSSRAQQLKVETGHAEALAAEIKRRFGLTP